MVRANRHHIPRQVWHITHRCHKKEFLLKSERFVLGALEKIQVRAKRRKMREVVDGYELREPQAAYNAYFTLENQLLRIDNGYYWND